MAPQIVHLELLLGTKVRDPNNNVVGRIEEVRTEDQNGECVVVAYLIGRMALFERLSAWTLGLSILQVFGARKISTVHTIPWDKLDLGDPTHPRLRCSAEELISA